MRIVVCASMSASKEMVELEERLTEAGHVVILPKHTHEYASGTRTPETHAESAQNKLEGDLLREYFEVIKRGDAVLAVNVDKREKKNYIGGNTLIEMAFAHVLKKRLYVLNQLIDNVGYFDEIVAMNPFVLGGDIELIGKE